MRKLLLSLGVVALSVVAAPAEASSDPFLGEVATFAFNFCPRGWAALNGQLLPIAQNTALFALLGTTYGGNGQTTFALPLAKPIYTLTGAQVIQCIALQGVFPSRN